jgi:extracellular elastinolytic metalloproteinase
MRFKRGGPVAVPVGLVGLALGLGSVPATAAQSSAADTRDVALRYVAAHAKQLGVEAADVADLAVTSQYRSAHSGVTHVNLNQRHRGLEVFGGHVTVNVGADGRVIFAGDSLVRGLSGGTDAATIGVAEAVDAAADGLKLEEPTDVRVIKRAGGAARETVVSRAGISEEPIPARLGYQPTADGLRLAWQLTIDDTSDAHLWNATVDAGTGKLLDADDWTSHDSQESLTSGLARDAAAPARSAAFSSPFPVDDGSSYRVVGFSAESPNDAERSLVGNPADALASPFGWHDTDAAAGPEFTTTRGNNVHAYPDQDNDNTADFGDTDGGPGLTFDFEADLTEHAQSYRDAAVTNLFYANNMIHDVLYQYGFDEASGNFQTNNYGRGGGQGDYVRAEAADGGGTNNANFSTPAADAGTPRMQMYLWPGNQFGPQNTVTVDGGGTYGASWARFTPAPTNAGLPGHRLLYAGTGCAAELYPADPPANWIAVVDGGTDACSYLQRVQVAESLGAKAVVVAHNAEGNAPVLPGSMAGPPVGIPAVAVTQADGAAIKAAIASGSTSGSVHKSAAHPGIRDGDLENGIILHEYGHGVSNRLTGGPGINCLSGNEQAGEGWSDFLAITLLLNPALDDPESARGMGPYALFQGDRHGAGIRPRPYSRNMEIQPFTYDSIKTGGWLNGTSLALPHGLGHGWAAVLWDMTWDLIDKHGFNPDIYAAWNTGGNNRAIQYVIDGLKLQGCGPGLVVARAAIIAGADELSDGEDTCTLWASFARRGLGYSAVQGTTNRNDNSEAFDTHPDCRRSFQSPVKDGEALNTHDAGDAVPLRFTADGARNPDILARNSPYSRLVDCDTLQTVGPGPFITPRPTPVATRTPGNSKLTVNSNGVYTYPWLTQEDWAGTCREIVLTRTDGKQHRAYFRFE